MNEPTLDDIESPGPRELTRGQRRVLGVLIEKGITTPEQYPLTLKSATTGCNQKSNRDPVTNYTEEQVQQYLDELRGHGLVACIHTESGRTERFRQYARKKYPFNEKQLAIMTELWLRGRQQPGELRTRASRMAEISSQEELRAELQTLMDQGFVQSDGPLERRGVLVDHTFYPPAETQRLQSRPAAGTMESADDESADVREHGHLHHDAAPGLESSIRELRAAHETVATDVATLLEQVAALRSEMEDIRRQLGM
jgi:uncharacterized protein YceH (UPF0502 family)